MLMIINAINAVVCYQVREIMWIYIICIELNYLVLAGIFSVYPASVVKTFGLKYGPQIYTIIILGSPGSMIINTFIMKVLYKYIGEFPILCFGSGVSIAGLIVCLYFDESLDIEDMDKKGLIEWTYTKKEEK